MKTLAPCLPHNSGYYQYWCISWVLLLTSGWGPCSFQVSLTYRVLVSVVYALFLANRKLGTKFSALDEDVCGTTVFNLPWGFSFLLMSYLCSKYSTLLFWGIMFFKNSKSGKHFQSINAEKYEAIAGRLPRVTIPKPLQVWSIALTWHPAIAFSSFISQKHVFRFVWRYKKWNNVWKLSAKQTKGWLEQLIVTRKVNLAHTQWDCQSGLL